MGFKRTFVVSPVAFKRREEDDAFGDFNEDENLSFDKPATQAFRTTGLSDREAAESDGASRSLSASAIHPPMNPERITNVDYGVSALRPRED